MRWGGIFDLDALRHTVDRLTNLSLRDGFWDDQKGAQKVMRDRAAAEDTVTGIERLVREVTDLRELLDMSDGDAEIAAEVAARVPQIEAAVRDLELKRMLEKDDNLEALVTIHPGAGGVDAQDWAEMLLRMYMRWADKRGFKVELISKQAGDEAGIKDASFLVKGPYAYGFLRAENGVHRLIRISPFDANKRRHTAFAVVKAVPNLDDEIREDEIQIRDEDLEVTTMRSGGAGGQHVNRTESAIRIHHVPTGFVIRCDQERSQHQNRDTAMRMLRGLLFEKARREREAAFEEAFGTDKNEIAFGSQVRTYTLQPYTMVKDERTEHKSSAADAVLDGDLDAFIEAFLLQNADKRLAKKRKLAGQEPT